MQPTQEDARLISNVRPVFHKSLVILYWEAEVMRTEEFDDQKEKLGNFFRRLSLGGETALQILAYQYVLRYSKRLNSVPNVARDKWLRAYRKVERQKHIVDFLDELVLQDAKGDRLSKWYQFLKGPL